MGLLIPLMMPIILVILFILSMVVFIMYLFPGYFETRKEFVKVWKQRTILGVTIVIFIVIIICFIMISVNLRNSIEEAEYTECFYYLVQYDLISGLVEGDYSFVGFDNLDTTV